MCRRAFAVIGVLFFAGFSTDAHAGNATVTVTYPPDLAITDLSVDAECRVTAKIVNSGAAIPAEVKDTAIQFWLNGSPFGGATIDAHNGLDALRVPGGVLMYSMGNKIGPNSRVMAKIDSFNQIREQSESNNELTKALTCTPRLPDLSIRLVSTTLDCRKVIEFANLGDGPMEGSWWNHSVERFIDGMHYTSLTLGEVDPARQIQQPGGRVHYLEPPDARAYEAYSYSVTGMGQQKSATNDSISGQVPAPCKAARPTFDLQLMGIGLGPDCRVVARVRNNGPATIPALASSLSIYYYMNGVRVGGWGLRIDHPLAPGVPVNSIGPFSDRSRNVDWKAVLEVPSGYPDSDRSNHERSARLFCP
jgi:hypothetical protein